MGMYNKCHVGNTLGETNMDKETAGSISFIGGVLAVCLSWGSNHSFWWAVFHFLCGWIYVIYWCVLKSGWFFGTGS